MADYSYDDTGVQFSYFLCAVLTLLLLPYTFRFVFCSSPPSFKSASSCYCSACFAKYKAQCARTRAAGRRARIYKSILLFFGWMLYCYQIHKAVSAIVAKTEEFNPWKILGVNKSANRTIVKKAYYKLSLIYHPDKVAEEERTAANDKFIVISKAYLTLTNDVAWKLFEDFGDPDGKRAMTMGIALPLWMVDTKSSPFVLLGYALIFGLLVPFSISRWWRRNNTMTKQNILHDTMSMYFRRLDESYDIIKIVNLLCSSSDFESDFESTGANASNTPAYDFDECLDRLVRSVLERLTPVDGKFASPVIESGYNIMAEILRHTSANQKSTSAATATSIAATTVNSLLNNASSPQGPEVLPAVELTEAEIAEFFTTASPRVAKAVRFILAAHMLRIDVDTFPRNVCDRVIIRAVHLLQRGIVQITLVRSWFLQTMISLDLIQQITQSMCPESPPFLQVPYLDDFLLHNLSVRSSLNMDANNLSRSVEDFAQRTTVAERQKLLTSIATAEQIKDIEAFLDAFPRLSIHDFSCKATGESVISPGCLVTCRIALRVVSSKADVNTFAFTERKRGSKDGSTDVDDSGAVLEFQSEGDGGGSGRNLKKIETPPAAHAPRFPAQKSPAWHIMLLYPQSNRIMAHQTVHGLTDVAKTVSLHFEAPSQLGTFGFHVLIQSDHFVGMDIRLSVSIEVVPRPPVTEIEDDISDPDEDTLAGQMAIMRGYKVNRNKNKKKSSGSSGASSSARPSAPSSKTSAVAAATAAGASAAPRKGARRIANKSRGKQKQETVSDSDSDSSSDSDSHSSGGSGSDSSSCSDSD